MTRANKEQNKTQSVAQHSGHSQRWCRTVILVNARLVSKRNAYNIVYNNMNKVRYFRKFCKCYRTLVLCKHIRQ